MSPHADPRSDPRLDPRADPRVDPRRLITQEAFSVAPHLLGLPLARPSRRLIAILLDLLIVAVLVNIGGSVFFGVAAAFAFFRFASRRLGKGGSFFGKTARFAFRGIGAFILFVVAIGVWNSTRDAVSHLGDDEDGEREERSQRTVQASVAGAGTNPSQQAPPLQTLVNAGRTAQSALALESAADSAAAGRAAERMVADLRRMGLADADIRQAVLSVAEESDHEWMEAAVRPALAGLDSAAVARPVGPDSLAVLYAAAVARADTPAADSLGARLGSLLAQDSLTKLRENLGEARENRDQARRELEKERERGVLASLLKLLDELGLGFGWNALYFTAFTALWKGQTPGKRLLGIRVVRLNGQPMTLWSAFERFGGYAAGLLTGLLGFAQVFWDRNRQAIHDKISETVVIRVRDGQTLTQPQASPPPAPAPRPAPAWTPPSAGGGPSTLRRPGT